MANRTPLYEAHLAAGARMVDFAGWLMPLHYGSQVAEHRAVRTDAGMFDVSHMLSVDVAGRDAQAFLQRVLANDVGRLAPGGALYSCMCNERGGVIDDVIAYRTDAGYRVVVNCATAEGDLAWLDRHAPPSVRLQPRRDLAMLAVQGPSARRRAAEALPEHAAAIVGPRRFTGSASGSAFIGRTGYTGEDGIEIMLPAAEAPGAWDALVSAGVAPAGLGARDTLRLEAGLNLYGNEMDQSITPPECGLSWTVALQPADRDFIGRAAIESQRPSVRLVGALLRDRGVIRPGQAIRTGDGDGTITSGTFSPTMGVSIAMARVPVGQSTTGQVEVRGRWLPVDLVDLPFVRNGVPRYPRGGSRP